MAAVTFTMQNMMDTIPTKEARWLYQARVDPHLTFGCEIIVDAAKNSLNEYDDVQKYYLRRMLGVHRRSEASFLYTGTGLLPIQARRTILALRYLIYLSQLPPHRLAFAALRECRSLVSNGNDCWLTDITNVVSSYHINIPHRDLSTASPEELTDVIQ